MFEPNEELFLRHIRENLKDEYATGVYADWLEEQGNSRFRLIQAFNRRDVDFLHDALGEFDFLLEQLTAEQQKQAAVNFAWIMPENRTPERTEILRLVWIYFPSSFPPEFDDFDDFEYDLNSSLSRTFPGESISTPAGAAYRAIDWAILPGSYMAASRAAIWAADWNTCYLIAASYYLFGINVMSDSFEVFMQSSSA